MTLTTAQKIEVLENLWNADNGLVVGKSCANYRDDTARLHNQAPIISGMETLRSVIKMIEAMAIADGDDLEVSRAIYGRDNSIRSVEAFA